MKNAQQLIESAWEDRNLLEDSSTVDAIEYVIEELDKGRMRICTKEGDQWQVHTWLKKAVILYFPLKKMETIEHGPFEFHDKIPLKKDFAKQQVRVVPQALARYGSHLEPGVVMMPSYVNIGAYVGNGTMVDTWATVGSCAQIGENVHLSGGVGIGGVLEPLQAAPTIIEDNCFIGARSEVVEGVVVKKNSVISMGVFIGKSTKILDRETGDILYGTIPEGSVVVSGSLPGKGGIHLYCAVIVKKVDERTRKKTAINDLLREE